MIACSSSSVRKVISESTLRFACQRVSVWFGSQSISATLRPALCQKVARQATVVDLPAPPLPVAATSILPVASCIIRHVQRVPRHQTIANGRARRRLRPGADHIQSVVARFKTLPRAAAVSAPDFNYENQRPPPFEPPNAADDFETSTKYSGTKKFLPLQQTPAVPN